jgi:hypothetical protein
LECLKRRNLSGDIHRCEDNIKTDLGETVCEGKLQTLCFEVILVGICTFTFSLPEKVAFESLLKLSYNLKMKVEYMIFIVF